MLNGEVGRRGVGSGLDQTAPDRMAGEAGDVVVMERPHQAGPVGVGGSRPSTWDLRRFKIALGEGRRTCYEMRERIIRRLRRLAQIFGDGTDTNG